MPTQHAKIPRQDPGHFALMLPSWSLTMKAEGMSPRTIEIYDDAVRFLAGWLRTKFDDLGDDWEQVTKDHVRGFWADLFDQGYAKGYINNLARAQQQFFKWLSEEEGIPNPILTVKVPRPPNPADSPPDVLTIEQLEMLIKDAEKGRDIFSRRDAAILRLFGSTGVRLAELACLEDPDVHARQADVVGKGGKRRTVRFNHKAALALDRYLRMRGRHRSVVERGVTALWLSATGKGGRGMTAKGIYRMVYRRGKRLGIAIYPHMFRHTFTHMYLLGGGKEGDLMELMGWDSGQMLRRYGRSAAGVRARTAYDSVDVMGGV